MVGLTKGLFKVKLNISGQNIPIKSQKLSDNKKHKDQYLGGAHIKHKNTDRLTVKEQKKTYHASIKHKKAKLVIFRSDKIDFRTRNIIRDKDIS